MSAERLLASMLLAVALPGCWSYAPAPPPRVEPPQANAQGVFQRDPGAVQVWITGRPSEAIYVVGTLATKASSTEGALNVMRERAGAEGLDGVVDVACTECGCSGTGYVLAPTEPQWWRTIGLRP